MTLSAIPSLRYSLFGSPDALMNGITATRAIREANLPAPGPVFLEPEPPRAEPHPSVESRLMFQIKGLVMQLSDVQAQLAQRDAEIQRLKEDLATTRAALERSVRKS